MANDVTVKDASNVTNSLKATDNGANKTPHHNVDVIAAGANRIGKVTIRNSADSADIDLISQASFDAKIGEVQASPTANTVLARLKDLLTGIVLSAGAAVIGAVKFAGNNWTPVPTYTSSADMSTAAAICPLPTSGQKVVADDITISVGTTMEFSVQMETSANILWSGFLLANTTVVLKLCNKLRADLIDKRLFGKASVSGQVRIFTSIHSE